MKFTDPREPRRAILGLVGAMAAADDQAKAMTDEELGRLLLEGGWTTIEVHEAGQRLLARAKEEQAESLLTPRQGGRMTDEEKVVIVPVGFKVRIVEDPACPPDKLFVIDTAAYKEKRGPYEEWLE